MKKIFLFIAVLVCASSAALHRQYFTGCESINEYTGMAIIGGTDYGTTGRLDHTQRFSGDSSCAAFITKANGPLNCSTPGDSTCQRHRFYFVWKGYSNYNMSDTNHLFGVGLRMPCFISMRVKYIGIVLHGHGQGNDSDWISDITATSDSMPGFSIVATTGIDSMGHGTIGNAPYTVSHGYKLDRRNDPLCKGCFKAGWNRLGFFINAPDSAHGYAKFWINGVLQDSATIRGMNGWINQAHFGLYASPAIPSGGVYDDQIIMSEVDSEIEAIATYESLVTNDSLGIGH